MVVPVVVAKPEPNAVIPADDPQSVPVPVMLPFVSTCKHWVEPEIVETERPPPAIFTPPANDEVAVAPEVMAPAPVRARPEVPRDRPPRKVEVAVVLPANWLPATVPFTESVVYGVAVPIPTKPKFDPAAVESERSGRTFVVAGGVVKAVGGVPKKRGGGW